MSKKRLSLEQLIRSQDWIYEDASTRWEDGLILGNGNLGIIGYAPYGLEWVLNKVDVFDGRIFHGRLVPHHKVMEHFHKKHLSNVLFLSEKEPFPKKSVGPLSKSAGLLRIRFGNETGWGAARPHRARQRLCLWEGELYYELDANLTHPRLRCVVPRDHNLFCVRMENCGAALWSHMMELVRPVDEDLKPAQWGITKNGVFLEQKMPHGDAHYAIAMRVVPTRGANPDDLFLKLIHPRYHPQKSGIGRPRLWKHHAQIPQFGNADIFVSIWTSYETRNPLAAATAEVKEASRKGFVFLEQSNRLWWKRFWERGWADFGKHKQIQKYWTFSLYQTGCLLGKAPIPGLYGLWYGPTNGPCSGVGAAWYTADQNVQMPTMPVFPLNRAELVEPFADTYLRVLPTLLKNTKQVFGRRGFHVPLCMNQLGEEVHGGAWRYSLCGGAYSGLILVWAWRYTRDKKLLKERLYPLLREMVRFYVDGMTVGDDGRYHLDWEIPPEILTMSRDATATLAMLKPCLETVVEGSLLFDCDTAERKIWEDVLARYPPYPKRKSGDWWAGIDVPEDHYTEAAYLLYPFFPAEAAGVEGEKNAARTLDLSGQHDIERCYADEKGRWHYKVLWAWFFPTVVQLRLGRKKEGWDALDECLRLFSMPNGLFTHLPVVEMDPRKTEANLRHIPKGKLRHTDGVFSPLSEFCCIDRIPTATLNPHSRRWVAPTPEGNGAFLFAATETLLQGHGGLIRLFPGVPRGFSGRFEKLLAQGGFEISAEMRKGLVVRCRITSHAGGKVSMLNPWKNWCPSLPHGSEIKKNSDRSMVFCIPLRRSETWSAVCPQKFIP